MMMMEDPKRLFVTYYVPTYSKRATQYGLPVWWSWPSFVRWPSCIKINSFFNLGSLGGRPAPKSRALAFQLSRNVISGGHLHYTMEAKNLCDQEYIVLERTLRRRLLGWCSSGLKQVKRELQIISHKMEQHSLIVPVGFVAGRRCANRGKSLRTVRKLHYVSWSLVLSS